MPWDEQFWQWEEAFQKFGFGDGDDIQHNDAVADFLRMEFGYHVETLYVSVHNPHIDLIEKGGQKIEFEGHEENEEIRAKLPPEVVKALDKEFRYG